MNEARACRDPRTQIRGLIEAPPAGRQYSVDMRPIRGLRSAASLKHCSERGVHPLACAAIRGLRSAASLKQPRPMRAGDIRQPDPRTQIRGLIEASMVTLQTVYILPDPRTQIRGLIEAGRR